MTREQLDAIRARVKAATPGPWLVFGGGRDAADLVAENGTDICRVERSYEPAKPNDADEAWANARLIENAPTDVPALLAEVERLTAERDTAFSRGVAAMREAAAQMLASYNVKVVDQFGRVATVTEDPMRILVAEVRALPDPEDKP